MLRITRLSFSFVRFVTPWVLRAAGEVFKLMALTLVSLYVGVPNATHRISESWVNRAVDNGFPLQFDKALYIVIRIVALLIIITGWVILSYTTVWGINLVFALLRA